MNKLNLRAKDLRQLTFPDDRSRSLAIDITRRYFKRGNKQEVLDLLENVLREPQQFQNDPRFAKLTEALLETPAPISSEAFRLVTTPKLNTIFGAQGIEAGALEQMQTAMQLPVAVQGALMPDAHTGYGLPIGGVLAVHNAVIPYGVGVDIGCRMCLSVFDLAAPFLKINKDSLAQTLFENTAFGREEMSRPMDDPIFERREFEEMPLLSSLKHKASRQIGSSGSGNHFVEFGLVRVLADDNPWRVPPGEYLALLSHSGSRNLGFTIANHYTKLAMQKCVLPKKARHLAWLDLDTQEGREYWHAMNLAGDYASANHHHIHRRIAKALGEAPLFMVENHHNFAWKEKLPDGREVIVHRKGATPAGVNDLGIIPGSMIHPGFIIRGKGHPSSLNSSSHGAGRVMSRTQATQSITRAALEKLLREHDVKLIGGGLDEAPIAYKDIRQVMGHQENLVEVLGEFHPKIVRMDK